MHTSWWLLRWVNGIVYILCWYFLGLMLRFSFLIAAATAVLDLSSSCLMILLDCILVERDLLCQVTLGHFATILTWPGLSISAATKWTSLGVLLRIGVDQLYITSASSHSSLYHTLRHRNLLTWVDQFLEIASVIDLGEASDAHVQAIHPWW